MKKIFSFCVASGVAAAMLSGCSKQIDDAYTNPNADIRKPIEQLLPGVIDNMTAHWGAGSNYGTTQDGMYIGKYVQYWVQNTANNQYDAMGGVVGASDLLGNVWAMHYFGQGHNINRIIEWGTEEQKWDYVGVAYAIRAWGWLTLTNMHGEAILDDAFNTSLRVFRYNQQADIYKEARRVAHLALSFLERTDGNVSQANLAIGDKWMNNGDVNKWKKFAYGVLARSFNQLTNKPEYNPDSAIFYAQKAMINNDENTYANFLGTGGPSTRHFWGPGRGNFGVQRQSKFVADLMSGLNDVFPGVNDPRAWYILRENPNGTFKGFRPTYGLETAVLPNANDRPNNFWGGLNATTVGLAVDTSRYLYRDNSPFPIITAAEMRFIEAEAQYRKGRKDLSLAAYREGIRLNLDMLANKYPQNIPEARKITPAVITSFLANTTLIPTEANLNLSHIMLQKYLALYGHGVIETWTDMRRYHYVDTETATGLQVYRNFETVPVDRRYVNNSGKLVYRCRPRYNSEYLYNIESLRAIGGLDLDFHTKETWFSQR